MSKHIQEIDDVTILSDDEALKYFERVSGELLDLIETRNNLDRIYDSRPSSKIGVISKRKAKELNIEASQVYDNIKTQIYSIICHRLNLGEKEHDFAMTIWDCLTESYHVPSQTVVTYKKLTNVINILKEEYNGGK